MAVREPPERENASAQEPVLPHGVNGVVGARRLEPARAAEKRAQNNLVRPDEDDADSGNPAHADF
jgi:hypothetical protein